MTSVYITDHTGAAYSNQIDISGSYTLYIPPGSTDPWGWVVEKYSYQRQSGTFTPAAGGVIPITTIFVPDVYITQPSASSVAAYTDIGTYDTLYDYAAYMRTQQLQYVLSYKSGPINDLSTVTLEIDKNASGMWSYNNATTTLTIKSNDLSSGTLMSQLKVRNLYVNSGTKLTLKNSDVLTIEPTASLSTLPKSTFADNSHLKMTGGAIVYNIFPSDSTVDVLGCASGAGVWTISDAVWQINKRTPNGSSVTVKARLAQNSVVSGWTISGTAKKDTILEFGFFSYGQTVTRLTHAGILKGGGTSEVFLDKYTYDGGDLVIPKDYANGNKWYFVDPAMSTGDRFTYGAGSASNSVDGFYAVVGFRPVIKVEKTGYAPKARLVASALNTKYPNIVVDIPQLSTLDLSHLFRAHTQMLTTDGYLPFIDSIDDKTTINQIDWTITLRQPGWQDASTVLTAASARRGTVSYTSSGAADPNYVNASSAQADAALIVIDTVAHTIATTSLSLNISPQRMYNAIKVWWSSYVSDVNFISNTALGALDIANYSTPSNITFTTPLETDVIKSVKTTGLINSNNNTATVIDSKGQSTIITVTNLSNATLALVDNTGKLFSFNTNVSGLKVYSAPAGSTGTWSWVVEAYPYKRQSGTIDVSAGGSILVVNSLIPDTNVTETDYAVVAAYTAFSNLDMFADYAALMRVNDPSIQFVTKLINAANCGSLNLVWDAAASSLWSYNKTSNTLTVKATAFVNPGIKYTSIITTGTMAFNGVQMKALYTTSSGPSLNFTLTGL